MNRNSTIRNKIFSAVLGAILVAAGATIAATWITTATQKDGIHSTWRSYEQGPAKKIAALNRLQTGLGFGGMIHEFKNYVLRRDAARKELVEKRIAEARLMITAYLAEDINPRERAALKNLSAVIDRYAANLIVVQSMIRAGRSPAEIDQAVRVDDAPALDAIVALDAESRLLQRAGMAAIQDAMDVVVLRSRAGMAGIGRLAGDAVDRPGLVPPGEPPSAAGPSGVARKRPTAL